MHFCMAAPPCWVELSYTSRVLSRHHFPPHYSHHCCPALSQKPLSFHFISSLLFWITSPQPTNERRRRGGGDDPNPGKSRRRRPIRRPHRHVRPARRQRPVPAPSVRGLRSSSSHPHQAARRRTHRSVRRWEQGRRRWRQQRRWWSARRGTV